MREARLIVVFGGTFELYEFRLPSGFDFAKSLPDDFMTWRVDLQLFYSGENAGKKRLMISSLTVAVDSRLMAVKGRLTAVSG